jgi:hypothetical protein
VGTDKISKTDRLIGVICAALVSLFLAGLACYAVLQLSIHLPVFNGLFDWMLGSLTRLLMVFALVLLFHFCGLMGLYWMLLRRAG